MMKLIREVASMAALAIGIATVPTPALAQTSATPPDPGADSGQLEEIVVTAQKRSESLQDVPISVTAATAETVKAAGVGGTIDIGRVAPGLTVTQTANAPLFFLRGVGTALGGTPGDEGSVNIVVDDVVYTSIPGTAFSLNNIERIEVLRGPQGTLFGRNAAGGVISIVTREPEQKPSLDLAVSYGNYKTVSASAYATTGLTDTLAGDVAIRYSDQGDGYGKNLFDGTDVNKSRDFSVRSKLVFDNGGTYVRLAGDYTNIKGDIGVPRKIIPGAIGLFGQVGRGRFQDVSENNPPASYLRAGGVSLKARQDLDWATLTSITAWRKSNSGFNFDQDGSVLPIINANFVSSEKQFTEELQLASPSSSKIKWIVGGFYLDSTAKEYPFTLTGLGLGAIFPGLTTTSRFGVITAKSYSGYAQATVPVTTTTNVTGGVRYTSDRRGFVFFDTSNFGPLLPPLDTAKTFKRLTWRAAVDQKLTDDILLYASVSSGFKAGSFNIINDLNPPIRPEKLISYEAGIKSELFDRHLRLNVSGFYYDYKSIQVVQIVTGQTFFLNAPGEIYGADVDFEVRPFAGFTLSGGAEFLHSKYGNFPNAPFTSPSPATCGPNGPVPSPGPRTGGNTTCPFNAKGFQLVRAPDFTSTVTAAYATPTSIGKLGISATYAHSASYPWEIDNRLRQARTDILNGQVSWQSTNGTLGVRLWAKNLTNEHYYYSQSSSLNDTGAQAAPRTYGVTLEGHF